ncbi:hypothetical protein [Flavobacterium sp.]|uniref:hypothetical protein n=1 Tax=Flavobacterium sp. TaxID=239 RepID=UPI00286A636E|nr:hypothetical protein [Flavobacterium sp.]
MKTNFLKTGKFLLKLALLLSLSLSVTNCSKDDDPVPTPVEPVLAPLQDPLAGYLTATGFSQKTTNQVNISDYEFGYSFIPLVNGKMTAIVAKIPDVRLGMRVTVWDKVAGTVLRTETIDIATAGVEVTKQITALDLVKDKEYFLTFNSNDWYDRRKTDGSIVTYPFTVGDIKITSYSFVGGTTQTIPNAPQNTYYAGDCSFKFQK